MPNDNDKIEFPKLSCQTPQGIQEIMDLHRQAILDIIGDATILKGIQPDEIIRPPDQHTIAGWSLLRGSHIHSS